jgi:hypothetical protein
MEAVAEHINEMQKIYEEYGSVFNDLMLTYRQVHPNKQASLNNSYLLLLNFSKGVVFLSNSIGVHVLVFFSACRAVLWLQWKLQ